MGWKIEQDCAVKSKGITLTTLHHKLYVFSVFSYQIRSKQVKIIDQITTTFLPHSVWAQFQDSQTALYSSVRFNKQRFQETTKQTDIHAINKYINSEKQKQKNQEHTGAFEHEGNGITPIVSLDGDDVIVPGALEHLGHVAKIHTHGDAPIATIVLEALRSEQ